MHQGCFVWTPTTPLLGRRTPRPGLCVHVRAPLGRVGRAGLAGAFWCASPLPVAGLSVLFVCLAPSGLGLPCLWLLLGFFFIFLAVPPLSLAFCVFWSGVPWAMASFCPPARPPPFFFSPSLPSCLCRSLVSGPGCRRPWPVVLLPRPASLASCFFPLPSDPPAFFYIYFFCRASVFSLFLSFFSFYVSALFSLPWCAGCAWVGLCVLGCGVWWCVSLWALCPGGSWFALALCCWVLPGCACSVLVVACRVAVLWCVVCFAQCCVACLRLAWFLLRAAGPCCCCLVPCCGRWLCSVLGCGAALLWCAASRAVCCCLRRVLLVVPCCSLRADWCCVLLPVVTGCSLRGFVACYCF